MTIPSNLKLFFATCALLGVLVISNNGGAKVTTVRSLLAGTAPSTTIPKPIDDRPMCSGPRRRANSTEPIAEPLYKKAIYGLQLGAQRRYGKFNNMIVELFSGVDVALDSGGHTVVVVSRWAHAGMMQFFPDEKSWEQLARDLPIVRENPDLKLQPLKWSTKDFLTRGPASFKEQQSWEVVQARRVNLLHYLFSGLQGEPCKFLSQIQDHLMKKFNQTKYVAVHVRNMEGKCALHNNGQYAKDQCDMTPEYIKAIMDSAGLNNLPIVILSDMQDEAKIHRIQDNLDQVVVPEWDFGAEPSMAADLVVATMGEIFIGQQGSSGSRNIGIIREAFGKDLSTNYVFMNKTAEGKWTNFVPHHVYHWRPRSVANQ
jgi:hypothetical protein